MCVYICIYIYIYICIYVYIYVYIYIYIYTGCTILLASFYYIKGQLLLVRALKLLVPDDRTVLISHPVYIYIYSYIDAVLYVNKLPSKTISQLLITLAKLLAILPNQLQF